MVDCLEQYKQCLDGIMKWKQCGRFTTTIETVVWLAVLFYGVSTLFGSFNAELNFKQFNLVYV